MFGTKTAKLKDGTVVTLRPMAASDEDALFRFFHALPDDLLIFIRHNVKDRRVIQEWVQRLNYKRVLPLLALVGDDIVADVTLHRVPHGWKRHIGRVSVLVHPQYRGRGLAKTLVTQILEGATRTRLSLAHTDDRLLQGIERVFGVVFRSQEPLRPRERSYLPWPRSPDRSLSFEVSSIHASAQGNSVNFKANISQ